MLLLQSNVCMAQNKLERPIRGGSGQDLFFPFGESANTLGYGDVTDMDPEQQQDTLRTVDSLDNSMIWLRPARLRQHIVFKKAVKKLSHIYGDRVRLSLAL
jgi:hypothetical protein